MKISIYALHLGFGGVEKYVSTLANMLAEEHDVEIISTYRIEEHPVFYLDPKIKVTYLLGDLKPNSAELKASVKSKNLFKIAKEVCKAAKVLYLKRHNNIVSIKHCDSDVIISTRIFHNQLIGKYAKEDSVKITGEHNHHNNNKKYIRSVIRSCKKFDYFIPISKELSEYYKPLLAEGVQSKYIKFCIDDHPDKSMPDFEKQDIISVGRLSQEKGVYDLISVFEQVHQENEKVRLHIVGDGPEHADVLRFIKEKNLEDAIVLHGFQSKAYIYELLPKMSLYVMTSFTESFGIVLLEAMSCGIPCVAYSSAQGAHEIIENGTNGFLIENRDCECMKEKICKLLANKETLRQLSKNAFATAEEFSYSNTKRAWLELMNAIAKEREKTYD